MTIPTATSPPASPGIPTRPMSAMIRPPRSTSRMSTGSRAGGSRASDEESKTAVKVAVRVRPPLRPTDPGYELIPQRFQRSMVHVTSPTSLAVDVPQGRKLFVFDRVFPETTDQSGIWEYLSDSVNSFMQGYNVSILAYGQSGAGKSYTMGTSGPGEQSDTNAMGVVPRAAQLLFEKLDGPKQHGRAQSSALRTPSRYSIGSPQAFNKPSFEKNWQMKATYVEIYNEHLRDLLLPDSTPAGDRSTVTIREDTKGRIILTGLHQVDINCFDDLIGALAFGSTIRQTDATAINAKSSRSHAVFSLNLVQRKSPASMMTAKEKRMSVPVEALSSSDAVVTVDSKLHFVDLAGSERLKNTGASGERAKEGISINAGLASLGKVISQLSSRQSGAHVSYRDSKLTRLLQDSLGGTAITYMVACVTPAEFHLSETLNTVQYAQRARAIQSKPRIQQVTDESDKQAVIDRLKAEISFLRQQIRNAEGEERKTVVQPERGERSNDREVELQNHLLDMQESYTSLSQRHAKLISELSKASDLNTEDPEELAAAIENSSVERLKRSHSFAESVEQVVLEYEKTIQSLESSLSNTRASLATTESSLLERESKCAYMDTLNTQLQSRVQKLMDRETSTETYLHDLESKLDGQSTGEEKNSSLITELRKEIARARENEASCEDYISTLEERLADSDQDMELMQREIHRLEHVVDRQRSLGKLDNLLYELDHIQQNGGAKGQKDESDLAQPTPPANQSWSARNRGNTLDILTEAVETAIPEDDDEDLVDRLSDVQESKDEERPRTAQSETAAVEETPTEDKETIDDFDHSPAQSKFVAEKLENVTQELLDLRMQHDTTQSEYDLLSAKYEEALRAMAEMQDQIDIARHPAGEISINGSRPDSFLENGKSEETKNGAQRSSSRSLSSELSSVEQSAISQDTSDTTVVSAHEGSVSSGVSPQSEEELKNLRQLLREHEEGMNLIAQKYAQLEAEHEDTVLLVEQLKSDIQKSKSSSSPTSPIGPAPVIRRMTSQNLASTVNRAHQSLAALRNIAVEEFEQRPDALHNFEQNLNAAMHELHHRMERIQALEAENASVKKEMEMKSTIISGLTRERSSLSGAKPMDMAMVSQMRDQIFQKDNEMKEMQEAHDAREQQLRAEIVSLQQALEDRPVSAAPAVAEDASEDHQARLGQLETELSEWKDKHQNAIASLELSEKQHQSISAELTATLASIDAIHAEHAKYVDSLTKENAASLKEAEEARDSQNAKVASLESEIENHQSTISTHLATITGLEASHAAAQEQLAHHVSTKEANDANSAVYQSRIAELEEEMSGHKALIDSHKSELANLQDTHSRELADLQAKGAAAEAANAEHESVIAELNAKHEESVAALKAEMSGSKDDITSLMNTISAVLNTQVTPVTVSDHLEDLVSEKQVLEGKYSDLIDANEELTKQLEASASNNEQTKESPETEARLTELATLVATLEEKLREKEQAIKKKDATISEIDAEKQKSVRLVEELEEQITSTFDQHHNRLSLMQNERTQALIDANAKVASLEREIETYRVRIEQLELQLKNSGNETSADRTSSMSSMTANLRKSTSTASLPSPPPAIPLPPLPSIASTASPPGSRHTSRELVSPQLIEDQESRIKTIEKHLYAEKQLTATLEEALGDLEAQSNKIKNDMEGWKKKAWQYEDELTTLRKERSTTRLSLQAVEQAQSARREAEAARAQLEERMNAINKKKKKSTLNCF